VEVPVCDHRVRCSLPGRNGAVCVSDPPNGRVRVEDDVSLGDHVVPVDLVLGHPLGMLPHDPFHVPAVHDARDEEEVEAIVDDRLGAGRFDDEGQAVLGDLPQELLHILPGHIQSPREHQGIRPARDDLPDLLGRKMLVRVEFGHVGPALPVDMHGQAPP